jgi:hypothetical protein
MARTVTLTLRTLLVAYAVLWAGSAFLALADFRSLDSDTEPTPLRDRLLGSAVMLVVACFLAAPVGWLRRYPLVFGSLLLFAVGVLVLAGMNKGLATPRQLAEFGVGLLLPFALQALLVLRTQRAAHAASSSGATATDVTR